MMLYPETTQQQTRLPPLHRHFLSCKETPGFLTHHTYIDCQTTTGKKIIDHKGQFIVPPVSEKKYPLILFDLDRNFIFAEPIPNRTKHSIKRAYANILKILQNRGLKPQLHILDNEASDIFK